MQNIAKYIEIGKRENIEDAYYISSCHSLCIVCDGVGGNQKGEEASRIAAETLGKFLKNATLNTFEQELIMAIEETQKAMQSYVSKVSEASQMATTVVLAKIFRDENQVVFAHIGDSRAYLYRNNDFVFKSEDHSLVNELIRSGFISENEAETHPQRNVITRSLNPNKSSSPDITWCNIQLGDKILLCSDGVLESWQDESLKNLFRENESPIFEIEQLKKQCLLYSKDNHTAIVVHIQKEQEENTTMPPQKKQSQTNPKKWLYFFIAIAIFIIALWYSLPKNKTTFTKKETTIQTTDLKTKKNDTVRNSLIELDTNKQNKKLN
jgi:protein phosphatase